MQNVLNTKQQDPYFFFFKKKNRFKGENEN